MREFIILNLFHNTLLSVSGMLLCISFYRKDLVSRVILKIGVLLILIPWMSFFLFQWIHTYPSIVSPKIEELLAAHYIMISFMIWKKTAYIFLISSAMFLGQFFWIRYIRPKVRVFFRERIKQSFHTKDQRFIRMYKKPFNIVTYIQKERLEANGFFIGKTAKDNVPIYLKKESICRHIQVVGPTGTGKTESVLKPISFQNAYLGHPTIFIDGKADVGLIKTFNKVFSNEKDRKFFSFNTLDIEEDRRYDVLETSNTCNFLSQLESPETLTDMLSQALEMESNSDADFYFKTQKAFLLHLFRLFLDTKKQFTFIDIVEFINYEDCRKQAYEFAKATNCLESIKDIRHYLSTLKKGYPELLGLKTTLEELFVSDSTVSKLVNTYNSDINIKKSLKNNDFLLFSLSSGNRYRSNSAIAKMTVSIINNFVGEKQGHQKKPFWMIVLDEFGQYPSKSLEPLITTARSSNTAMILSYQNAAQLEKYRGLQEIITSNSDTKIIFQTLDDADFWSRYMGTIESSKRTNPVEKDVFATEKILGVSSIREVDEFLIDPNGFRNLRQGQAILKYSPESKKRGMLASIINFERLKIDSDAMFLREKPTSSSTEKDGLYLREFRQHKVPSFKSPKKTTTEKTVTIGAVFSDD